MSRNRLLSIISVSFCFGLLLFVFRKLLLFPSTHLVDYRDYPLCIWIIYQNIEHIKNVSINGFFDSNIFYPFKGSLLFTDLLLPISIIGIPLSFFISEPVLLFNVLFFLTLLLNVLAAHFFWRKFFHSISGVFFASLVTIISPFFFQNSPHFQTISFWPMLMAFGFLFKKDRSHKDVILSGIFLTLQFLTSTYFAIFALPLMALWLALEALFKLKDKQKITRTIWHGVKLLAVFGLTSGFFILKYMKTSAAYQVVRDYGEYVSGSAQISDYVFTTHFRSLSTLIPWVASWNEMNMHGSLFPTFTVLALASMGIFSRFKNRFRNLFEINFTAERIFFFILTVWGFIASIGPRLTVNNLYLGTVLPYAVVLKLVPVLLPFRVVERWSIFFFIGLAFFATAGLERIKSKRKFLILVVATAFYLFECLPLSMPIETRDYYPAVYEPIKSLCEEKPKVMLEYPIEQDIGYGANVLTNLTYRTQQILASLKHKCLLVNGYSGYLPPDFIRYQTEIQTAVEFTDKENFFRLINQREVKIIKFNKKQIFQRKAKLLESWILGSKDIKIISNSDEYLVGQL